ncbi:hypothetical protein QP168_00585 [Aerococcus urinae]|uniref:Uncharacterized protein n=1 Tax=Aerococcus mictus TaxID=2976810 RepID=A0A1E9PJ68_9LACT|nr:MULTISPECIES: hypothetical protein [Aerococcus]KAA9293713.1 hypothetical protein F6I06_00865 [Aerococcus mictus]MBU5610569.1 hypothetical protein [Aerococcus urinae]MCY3033981.1 hypothetical protein [Aerococcus mictus]MCY3063270.1 hypothetical protein [Aerococcus mictus]MCY3065749.1 hypothetical protein [Aerococcus mictus]
MKQKDPLITRRSYRKAREKNNRKNIWRRLFKQEEEFDDQDEVDNESRPTPSVNHSEAASDQEGEEVSASSQEDETDLEATKAASQSADLDETNQSESVRKANQRPSIDRFLNWGIVILILAIIIVTAIAFFV